LANYVVIQSGYDQDMINDRGILQARGQKDASQKIAVWRSTHGKGVHSGMWSLKRHEETQRELAYELSSSLSIWER
jgi:hypothetical protein